MSERYCPEHKKVITKSTNRRYDKHTRNKEHSKFYNSTEWRQLRKVVMERNGGLCTKCAQLDIITQADVVDHIISITEDYSKRLDITNLQPLCHSHHNQKTADEENSQGRGA